MFYVHLCKYEKKNISLYYISLALTFYCNFIDKKIDTTKEVQYIRELSSTILF